MNTENEHARHDSLEYEKFFTVNRSHRVLDLGAHFGYFSELVVPRCQFVIGFEPHPINFIQLTNRLRNASNALLVNKAASNATNKFPLYECPTNDGAHSLIKHGQCSDSFQSVDVVDIGEWLIALGYKPDFIKIDTEGSEANIMLSLFRVGICPDIAVECHDSNLYWRCRNLSELSNLTWHPDTEHVGVCYATKK